MIVTTTEDSLETRSTVSSILSSLNRAQLQAVEHSPLLPLQILAGPGSGKTKVLTSRVAYLILHHAIPPSSICAVTFTNKAANEMRERLKRMTGEHYTSQIKMGTFHALCAQFLRRYANVVGLERNFTVCDAEESKKLVANLLKPYKHHLAAQDVALKDTTVLSMISHAKARGQVAASMSKECKTLQKPVPSPTELINAIVAEIYNEYEKMLRQTNSLDFDDLLLFGVKLFREHPKAVDWCKHVLVDEFQDTNTIQYELMQALAIRKCITVVGDPDQSIYGWRSADVGNLVKMQKDYPQTQQIFLEENYRSTGSILSVSLAIVAQDRSRVQKSLFTSHPTGTSPTLRLLPSEQDEATQIAFEIKRAIAYTGDRLNYGDFAILLRFTALSRTIESALQKEGIPSRILGGHKFFERLEIKDLLAYLQLIDNSDYSPAFNRAINVPSRGIGEKSLEEILRKAKDKNLSLLATVEKICDNRIPDTKPPIKRKLDGFVKAIGNLKRLASEGMQPAELIRRLIALIEYENHLKKTQSDWETRWENVQELITFASEVSIDNVDNTPRDEDEPQESPTPLRLFLQASMLSSEGDKESEGNKEKVTIVTCHAAKGLEWPVVFVPSVEDGTFPFYRTDDVEEERRLLYVACTRAQCLLYLTYAEKRKVAGETKKKAITPFLSAINDQMLFSHAMPDLNPSNCLTILRMLNRPEPDKEQVRLQVAEYTRKYQVDAPYDDDELNWPPHSWSTAKKCESQVNAGPLIQPTFTVSGHIMERGCSASSTSQSNPIRGSTADMACGSVHLSWDGAPAAPYSSHTHLLKGVAPSLPPAILSPTQHFSPPIEALRTKSTSSDSTKERSTETNQGAPSMFGAATGVKRRLGMGWSTTGYSNKKFKPPT